ncbi:hypothetical protein FACS1894152_3760 [Bacilli bacterium]|nr:hypothetical protein FACS1894152_3760 [Bacilli bacterium]
MVVDMVTRMTKVKAKNVVMKERELMKTMKHLKYYLGLEKGLLPLVLIVKMALVSVLLSLTS